MREKLNSIIFVSFKEKQSNKRDKYGHTLDGLHDFQGFR